jgi:hypothetical protein
MCGSGIFMEFYFALDHVPKKLIDFRNMLQHFECERVTAGARLPLSMNKRARKRRENAPQAESFYIMNVQRMCRLCRSALEEEMTGPGQGRFRKLAMAGSGSQQNGG